MARLWLECSNPDISVSVKESIKNEIWGDNLHTSPTIVKDINAAIRAKTNFNPDGY
jgi:hypothetical protein